MSYTIGLFDYLDNNQAHDQVLETCLFYCWGRVHFYLTCDYWMQNISHILLTHVSWAADFS